MKVFILIVIAFASAHIAEGKTLTRCELAKELLRQGFPKSQLNDWVCLIEAESSRRTDNVGPPNRNGSKDYGLFQLNSYLWCKIGSAGNDCKVKCEDVSTDDITKACACAKKVYARHGFSGWYGWKDKCRSKRIANAVKECKL